jgi:quercetin dioxygenase-like cupin family protein
VQIFRFDPEVSIPVSQFGSSFAIGPLIGPDSNVQIQIIHVRPGGLIGRHLASGRQFFAVVTGSGWGSGPDGQHRTLRAAYGALWEEGEEHEAGTDTGLTAACIQGVFDMWAMGVTREIVVCDYDPQWT